MGLGRVCSPAKVVGYIILALYCAVGYGLFKMYTEEVAWYLRPSPCFYPKDVQQDLIELTRRLHKLLESQNIPYFLCYGTLWGAMRMQARLPWDNDVEFCITSEDLDTKNEEYFYRMFKWSNISISYNPRQGLYDLHYKKARGQLVVFQLSDDFVWFKRTGVAGGLKNFKFPSKLLSPPLPTLRFHEMDLPVPRGDIEIQKYMYPDTWWREVKPPNCEGIQGNSVQEGI